MKPAIIHVKDEVNCKIEGLDLDTRRKLSNLFSYEIPYARYLPAVRLGRWNGKKAFFQLGGSTYINLLPEILESKNHDWFLGVQFHPELKSKPFDPHPLFKSFINAAKLNSRLV